MNRSQSKYFNTAAKMNKALIDLLNEKPFEYITVSDVCKKAGVHRSTFYLHYENTHDLLEETTRYLLNDFFSYLGADPSVLSEDFARATSDELIFISAEYLHPYLTYIRDHQRIFTTALSHAELLGFEDIFRNMFRRIFDPILSRFRYPSDIREYVMRFYLTGITAIVLHWLKNDCHESLDELSHIIHQCIFGLNHT